MLGDFALELGTRMSRSGSPSARRRTDTRSCAPIIPITDLAEGDWPIDPALALSIARRESEFDPGVISHAGAMGLMQVMPGTGRDTAADWKSSTNRTACWAIRTTTRFWRPSYIAGLNERFDGNVVLVSAGYNAGPRRASDWIERFGDPRRRMPTASSTGSRRSPSPRRATTSCA
jgi:soluble lytic murein transglycosylase-like protein